MATFRTGAALVAAILLLLVALPRSACAISGTMQVAYPGHAVTAKPKWPQGVAEFVNLPYRTTGWNPFFSGYPNDVCHYHFRVENTDDLNALVAKFAEIDSDGLEIVLTPDNHQKWAIIRGRRSDSQPEQVSLTIGDQGRLDQWFEHLKRDEDGVRVKGQRRYLFPPVAMPPKLVISVQDPAIDLDRLQVPANVRVTSAVSEPESAAIEAIGRFQRRRAAE